MSARVDDPEAYVTAMATVLGLPIPAESRLSVVENVARLLAAAAFVMDFPLPEDVEAAPIFRP
jgi:hypothetical protein